MTQAALRLVSIVIPFAIACGSQTTAAPGAKSPFSPDSVAAQPVSPNLAVSGELGAQCALHFNDSDSARSPKFDFDRFQLDAADRNVLEQVANCLTAGPLKGKRVQLVGRADPRGTDEYNLALGDNRARAVGHYLTDLGVDEAQLAVKTRGALDAKGRDERTWQLDRRVDLRLEN